MKRLSLRFLVPLLVTCFFLIVMLVAFATSRHFVLQELEHIVLNDLRVRLNATQGTVERFLLLQHKEGVDQVVSSSGSDLDLRVRFVADHEGNVVNSTRIREVGTHWSALEYPIDPQAVDRVTRARLIELQVDKANAVISGYASICDPSATGSLRSQRCGLLFHQIDFRGHRAHAIDSLYRQASFAAIGFALSALIMAFIVHRRITVRVASLAQTLTRFVDGEREIRSDIDGGDEIAAIGSQINGLLDKLAMDEAALKQSEHFKQAIIDSADASIISTDAQGLIASVSAGAERMLGYSANELVGRVTPAVLHDRDEVVQHAAEMSRELGVNFEPGFEAFVARTRLGEIDENEWTYIHKNGARLRVLLSVTALTDDERNITGFVGVARDVTQQKAMARRLRLTEKVFESTGEAILVTDAHSRIIDVNAAYLAMSGYAREELIGESPSITKSNRHDEGFYRSMRESITRTGSWSGEIWSKRKHGEVFPQWITINEIRDDQGTLTNYVSITKDITRQKALEGRLEQMAYYDPLTQLPNRTLFRDRLDHALRQAERDRTKLAALFIDLDGFKYVNDSQGHDTGDKLLREAARRIVSTVRKTDTVARLGGDEFTVILSGLKNSDCVGEIAAKLIAVLKQAFVIDGKQLFIGGSIGIAVYPDDGRDFLTLTKNADAAMYLAKQAGRGTYRFFTQDLNETSARRMELANGLRSAVERNELSLRYQPKLDMQNGNLLGFEALLRWQRHDGSLVSPVEFVPLAEETGLIVPIGEWVLHRACAQLRQWHDAGFDKLQLAVNISMRQLEQERLVSTVKTALDEHGIPSQALELELTESILMSDAERAMAIMGRLRDLNIRLSVDDFGTGHSSLSYLKRLPIQTLKIDRSFVRDIVSDPDDAAIIRAILSMAEQLRLNVVAEGVETQAQHDFLHAEGCSQAQGYLYAKPLTAEDATDLLQRSKKSPRRETLSSVFMDKY